MPVCCIAFRRLQNAEKGSPEINSCVSSTGRGDSICYHGLIPATKLLPTLSASYFRILDINRVDE
ncbi:hypothetical protein I7I50_07179 [Histoplasma capsulatum G186AR]|uniref:Uncharacterized protein n=1 Tax=Ajellomyces capsulatus TaxID=5037 RepID=A0A8H8D2Q1_AJECA|nr:hypothetical protein I7I52_09749 [Histoplasma capsulatum]QSS67944.1 hypothetical protein I7I50_07179 [Histoplasma capsulatum G186AR]